MEAEQAQALNPYDLAGITRCISCGQAPPSIDSMQRPKTSGILNAPRNVIERSGGRAPNGIWLPNISGGGASLGSREGRMLMDDEISEASHESAAQLAGESFASLPSQSLTMQAGTNQQLVNLLTGNAGLRSLLPQHRPMNPVKAPISAKKQRSSAAGGEKSLSEPRYRKGMIASQSKELVKQQSSNRPLLQSQSSFMHGQNEAGHLDTVGTNDEVGSIISQEQQVVSSKGVPLPSIVHTSRDQDPDALSMTVAPAVMNTYF
jgi:hypothetical protein